MSGRPLQSRAGNRAFTLIEVMLVLALVIALLAGVGGISQRVLEHRARSRELMRVDGVADEVLGTLDRELSSCTVGDSRNGAGLRGDAASIRIVSRGVVLEEGDRIVTELAFDAGRGEIRAARRPGGTAGVGARAGAGTDLEVIGGGVEAMRLRYRVGDEWASEFDSLAAGRLPKAVEVELWFGTAEAAAPESGAGLKTRPAETPADGTKGSSAEGARGSRSSEASVPSRPADRVRTFAIPDAEDDEDEPGPSDVGGGAGV